MTALVVIETVVVALVVLLVAGLLRSHAEILRRLDAGSPDTDERLASSREAPPRPNGQRAPDILGTTLRGGLVKVGLGSGQQTLLAFLTSGCSTCRDLWAELHTPSPTLTGGIRVIAVTKDARFESSSQLRKLAPGSLTVVMSSAAWEDYAVPASPYFVHVGAAGAIEGEGVAPTLAGVGSLLADAVEDARLAAGGNGLARAQRAEAELAEAGIGAGHPSLYPTDGERS